MIFFKTPEYAVRYIVSTISSPTAEIALRNISSVIGSGILQDSLAGSGDPTTDAERKQLPVSQRRGERDSQRQRQQTHAGHHEDGMPRTDRVTDHAVDHGCDRATADRAGVKQAER